MRGRGRLILGAGSIAIAAAIGLSSSAHASGTTFTVCSSGCAFTSIQSAIDDAGTRNGDTIDVGAGTFAENVTINKSLTLAGAQAGVDARNRSAGESILKSVSISGASNVTVDGFQFNGSGSQVSVTSPTTLSGIVVQNDIFSGYSSVGLPTYDAGNILIQHNLFENVSGSGEAMQIKASTVAGGCNGSQVLNNRFAAATNNGGADVNFSCTGSDSTGVTVSGNTTSGTGGGSSFTAFSGVDGGISVTNNSGSTDASSIYFFGSVTGTATITGNTFTGGGGNAVSIHAGDYTSDGPNTGTFTITGNTLSGNVRGISISSGGLSGGGAVVAHNNDLSGNSSAGALNATAAQVDLSQNWWGAVAGPGTLPQATTKPWCTASGCATLSNAADLTALTLSSGSLSPAFSSATTSYTASVDNAVGSVVVTATASPGASTVLTGGSSLAVGTNTLRLTVTSADGSETKVFTVTLTRAAATTTATTTTATTTTTPTTTTTAAPPPPPPVNKPAAAPAKPGTSGTVAVSVSSPPTSTSTPGAPAPKPVSVGLTWTPTAFTVPVTVALTPKPVETPATTPGAPAPTPPPVAGGFSVGSTVVQVTVTTDSGEAVTQFAAPLVIHISSFPAGQVPAYSHDGTTWTTIPRLDAPLLPDGQSDGYFANTDGSLDIYTRHATLFGLLLDTEAPTQPTLHSRLDHGKLRLLVYAKDNVRIAHYLVLFNGRPAKQTKHAYLVLLARKGSFQVIAVDTAGNRARASAAVIVR